MLLIKTRALAHHSIPSFLPHRVQRVINQRAIDACKAHVNAVAKVFNGAERAAIVAQLNVLERTLALRKKKNVGLIAQAESFALLVGAGRITSCKSAKDRTGMAVTLEQAEYLQQYVGIRDAKWANVATNVMRARGTRRENVEKNTGSPYYAFNKVQVHQLPPHYRPPIGSFGGKVT